jgi:hypothetical protein
MKLMFNTKFIKQHPSLTATVTAVVLIAILFSFAPVRVMAANLLSVFRVQQVKVVRVNMNALDRYEDNDEMKGLLDRLDSEPERVSGDEEPTEVNSIDEAAGMVDFSVARIQALPDNAGEPSEILVHGQTVHHLTLDKDLLEEIFDAAGIELSLPDSLNERPIIITRPNGVTQAWGSEESKDLFFAQFRSPEIDHPDDLDIKAFGIAILQFLGKSKEEATQLGESIDWANTLLLPIPNDDDVNATEVSINGTDGVLFEADHDSGSNSVMWTTNGVTYMLGGNYSAEQVLEMAWSVQ